jgi:hypothetical protein
MNSFIRAITNTFIVIGYMLAALLAGAFASACVTMSTGSYDLQRSAMFTVGGLLLGLVFGLRRCMSSGKSAA